MTDPESQARTTLTRWLGAETELHRRFLRKFTFKDGDFVFHQGDAARDAFFIQQGSVELSVALPGGAVSQLAVLGPGDVLGEGSLISNAARSATARAQGELHAWCVDRSDLAAICAYFDPASLDFLRRLAGTLAHRVHATSDRALSLLGIPEEAPSIIPRGTEARWEQAGTRGAGFEPGPFLPRLPFFADFSPEDIDALLQRGTLWSLPAQATLFQKGEQSNFVAIVVRGAVKICGGSPPRCESLGLLGPGTLAGVCSLVGRRARHASAVVREDATLLRINQEAFEVLMQPGERLNQRFLAALTRDLLSRQLSGNRTLARIEQQQLVGVKALRRP